MSKKNTVDKNFAQCVLMVRPASFGFNNQTAASNSFQKETPLESGLKEKVLNEFDLLVNQLKAAGIQVIVWNDNPGRIKPDAIFPNNWFSTNGNYQMVLYPMFAPNRRLERDAELIAKIKSEFRVDELIDFTGFEQKGIFLEGTGSIVFDHREKLAYACQSVRTSEEILSLLCKKIGYRYFLFHAFDRKGDPIYHTNVLMCLGKDAVVVCLESVEKSERPSLLSQLTHSHKEVIEISLEQMENFAGNMLFLQNETKKNFWVLSQRAFNTLNREQRLKLEKSGELLFADISTIENIGGGGVRCMMAEIFFKPKSI